MNRNSVMLQSKHIHLYIMMHSYTKLYLIIDHDEDDFIIIWNNKIDII